jgi:hypothetical protein
MLKCFLLLPALCPAGAQQSPRVNSRAEEIEAARREKSRNLRPDIPPKPERVLNTIKEKRIVERITGGVAGMRVRLGGLATGQGFALGPEYIRRDLAHEQVTFRSSAIASIKQAYLIDMELDMPRLADSHAFVNLYSVHRNFPRLQYYGPGPNSSINGRSDYRFEDTTFSTRAGVRPWRPLHLGVHGG